MLAFKSHIFNLPVSKKLGFFWSIGFLLGFVLVIQLISGIILSVLYSPYSEVSFIVMDELNRDIIGGSWLRRIHVKGASLFFLCLYAHIARGMYFKSYYRATKAWMIGMVIFMLSIIIAFLGYVLPWGKMSYWAATVITKLLSVVSIPLVEWIWGGFSVSGVTLSRFFSLHVILPFILIVLVMIHLYFLHSTQSNNPLGVDGVVVRFHPYFTIKDLFSMILALFLLKYIVFIYPFIFLDCDNMIEANPLVTPVHIMPEWYFLSAYAVLRAVPNKLGGVIGLVLVFGVLFLKPYFEFKFSNKILFFYWLCTFLALLWLGAAPPQGAYLFLSRLFTFLYFFFIYFV